MAITEVVTPTASDAATTSEGAAAPPSGSKTTAFLLATLLVLVAAGALAYTQWWIPLEKAQQRAVTYQHCVEEVQVYQGKHSYAGRLAQCTQFLNG
jgi:hypothetical protein